MLLFLLIWFKFRDLSYISLAAPSPSPSSPAQHALHCSFLMKTYCLIASFQHFCKCQRQKRHPYNMTWQQQVHIHNENNWWHSPPDTGRWWEYVSPAWHVTRSHVTVTRRDESWHSTLMLMVGAAACMGTPSGSGSDPITHAGTGAAEPSLHYSSRVVL